LSSPLIFSLELTDRCCSPRFFDPVFSSLPAPSRIASLVALMMLWLLPQMEASSRPSN